MRTLEAICRNKQALFHYSNCNTTTIALKQLQCTHDANSYDDDIDHGDDDDEDVGSDKSQ